jgi:hypothetical protein
VQAFGSGETDAAVAAGNNGDLVLKAIHESLQTSCTIELRRVVRPAAFAPGSGNFDT